MGAIEHLIATFAFVAFASVLLTSKAQDKPRPTAFLLPITKDQASNLFFTSLRFGSSPPSSLNLLLDLANNLTWFDCSRNKSSSRRLIPCPSPICTSISGSACDNVSCFHRQYNPLTHKLVTGRVNQDRVSLHSTDGAKPVAPFSVRPFTFLCAAPDNLGDTARTAAGIMGLGGGDKSFPAQVTSAFNIARKFALCLPSEGTGHFYIGGGRYFIPPYKDGISFTLTPFATLPSTSEGYFISIKSISVDGNPVSFDQNLLSVDGNGTGGTKISMVDPYTVLHSDIYRALVKGFAKRAEAMGMRKAPAVAPFGDCYERSSARDSETGPMVPPIDVAVPGRIRDVTWRFYGANSMVKVKETVMCLAFVDGGGRPKTSVVIGSYQLQNYLLEFDLTTSILGFSSSLLLNDTSCSSWPTLK